MAPPDPYRQTGLTRSFLAVAVLAATTVAFGHVTAHALVVAQGAPHDVEAWVVVAVTGAGTAAAGTLALGALLLLAGAATRTAGRASRRLERAAEHLTPAILRRAVAVTVGTGLSFGLAGTATAQEMDLDLGWGTGHGPTATEAGALPPSPTDPRVAAPTHPGTAPSTEYSVTQTTLTPVTSSATDASDADPGPAASDVEVRRGDTLWGIAASHLGPDAAPEEIAAAWPRWHATNLAVIGEDPDLIHPGQTLVAPTPLTEETS